MSISDYEFWFIVGSQFLYGPEVLKTVASRAAEMAAENTTEVSTAPFSPFRMRDSFRAP